MRWRRFLGEAVAVVVGVLTAGSLRAQSPVDHTFLVVSAGGSRDQVHVDEIRYRDGFTVAAAIGRQLRSRIAVQAEIQGLHFPQASAVEVDKPCAPQDVCTFDHNRATVLETGLTTVVSKASVDVVPTLIGGIGIRSLWLDGTRTNGWMDTKPFAQIGVGLAAPTPNGDAWLIEVRYQRAPTAHHVQWTLPITLGYRF